ncbi:hypothetical protein N825_02455 [Skermanella stibiiresistens SB22]|uniref:Uncharacterized protein n=1 Tax=Skermanella stibiiresistens SB22 TaxID=1385369 RepID=W9H9C4_9PROT|nr:hypothetical protein [Skermanella stibiiresistens]EWY42880.1 hypothetical protein N825_02455 [Skermanella stibiiresistens SB22]
MFDETNDLAELPEDDQLKRIVRRCAYLQETFEKYNSRLITTGLTGATMNKVLLINCVESYFLDINRLKAFHGMERADRFKIAGYLLKWLCKIKPIQIGPLGDLPANLQKRGLVVNENFALIHALIIAKVDKAKIEQRLVTSLLYSAHYRDLNGGVMAMQMETLARAYPRAF